MEKRENLSSKGQSTKVNRRVMELRLLIGKENKMGNANVIILGASGVGKTTLINAVRGTDYKNEITKDVTEYPCDEIGISLVDTVGFEPNARRRQTAIKKIQEWTKTGIKKGDEERSIDAVWFCVDGTARRLFDDYIEGLTKAIKVWKGVPVIVVITKSYSETEQEENKDMISMAFAKQKKPVNLKKIIPVVASPFSINNEYLVPATGLDDLIDYTLEVIPEGKKAKEKAIADFKLKRKRVWAQSIIAASTGTATTIGAIPVPFSDALILSPLEMIEIKGISKVYEIEKSPDADNVVQMLVEMGTAGAVAKAILNGLKAIPGVQVAADVLNAIVAGSIVAAIGEGSQIIYEQIYLGNKSVSDIEWIKKIVESTVGNSIMAGVDEIIKTIQAKGKIELSDVLMLVKKVFIDKKN